MRDDAWIKTLEDGRKVKFIYLELPDHGAFINSVVLTKARIPLVVKMSKAILRASFQRNNPTLFHPSERTQFGTISRSIEGQRFVQSQDFLESVPTSARLDSCTIRWSSFSNANFSSSFCAN
jgi:hypothetical protein